MKRSEAQPVVESSVAKLELVPDGGRVEAKFRAWFTGLPEDVIRRLVVYYMELIRFNKTHNLIPASTVKNAESTHVADAVLAWKHVQTHAIAGQAIYDFGSGNGCPGLVFAALASSTPGRADFQFVLVDRDQRKIDFCRQAATAMGLKNVTCVTQSVEEVAAGSVVNVVARGFTPFSRALIVFRKQFARNGRFFHMKGDGWANELAQLPSQVFSHWTPSLLGQYRLPESAVEMFVVLTEKKSD